MSTFHYRSEKNLFSKAIILEIWNSSKKDFLYQFSTTK